MVSGPNGGRPLGTDGLGLCLRNHPNAAHSEVHTAQTPFPSVIGQEWGLFILIETQCRKGSGGKVQPEVKGLLPASQSVKHQQAASGKNQNRPSRQQPQRSKSETGDIEPQLRPGSNGQEDALDHQQSLKPLPNPVGFREQGQQPNEEEINSHYGT